ncbi:unnamed protein product [Sphagnum balticum]|jgi:hypothetical protein
MGRGLAHAPGAAAWAKASALAAEGDQVFGMARFALGAQESVGQNPAAQIPFELFDDEIRQWVAGVSLDLLPKREPIVLDDFVECRLFGPVSTVVVPFNCGCVCHRG